MAKKKINKVYLRKSDKISETLFVDLFDAIDDQEAIANKVTKRIDYILKYICKIYDLNSVSWNYYNNEAVVENNVVNIYLSLVQSSIMVDTDIDEGEVLTINSLGKEWYFDNTIPFRWLFNDFEKEIIDGRKKHLEEIKELDLALARKSNIDRVNEIIANMTHAEKVELAKSMVLKPKKGK